MLKASENGRLKRALTRQAEAEQALQKARAIVRRIVAGTAMAGDPQRQELLEQVKQAKEKQHRHRMNIGRKRYSLGCKQAMVERVKAALADCQAEDDRMTREIEAIETKLAEVEHRLMVQTTEVLPAIDFPRGIIWQKQAEAAKGK